MAASNNPFYVEPTNALQALMSGVQGYDRAQKSAQQDQIKQVREMAAQDVMQGGNPQSALARLLSVGDNDGAKTLATVIHNKTQADFQQQQLGQQASQFGVTSAESARHNRATEGTAAAALNKPMVLPFGSGLVDRSGNVLREPSGEASLDPATLDFMAKQYMAGDTSVLTNLGRGAQGAQNVVALRKKVAELNQAQGAGGADQAVRNAEFFGTKAGQRTLGTRSANIELAATEFKQVLPVVMEASNAVDRTQYSDLNKIIQSFNTRTGDPAIVKFGGGVNTLINLYSRAISPTGVPTVSDKDHAREILSKAWSQGQFNAAVGMMTQEIEAALASPEKVRDDMRKRFLGGQPGQQAAPNTATPAAQSGGVVDWRSYFGNK